MGLWAHESIVPWALAPWALGPWALPHGPRGFLYGPIFPVWLRNPYLYCPVPHASYFLLFGENEMPSGRGRFVDHSPCLSAGPDLPEVGVATDQEGIHLQHRGFP